MGLDMFLTANRYLSQYDELDAPLAEKIQSLAGLKKHKVKSIRIDAMYWRKANAIHGWFVQNVQDGNDDCREYELSREDLNHLLNNCRKVLQNRKLAEELLPVTEGFFFGSYDYDDWYFQYIQETEQAIQEILETFDNNYYFTYQSSW